MDPIEIWRLKKGAGNAMILMAGALGTCHVRKLGPEGSIEGMGSGVGILRYTG